MIQLPRIRFAHLPTATEPLPRLSAALDGPALLAKRDDQTGLAFGGNKTRKLEFLLAEAQAHGAKTLITAGAAQSNHCRQTAAAAARFGFDCILVLSRPDSSSPDSGDQPEDQEGKFSALPYSGNLLLDSLFGAEIVWTSRAGRDQALQQNFDSAWKAGRGPYLIPYGGSNATGAAAYAFALRELLEENGLERQPDWIVFASSSGGTQAGLALGARLFGYQGRVLGISVDEPKQVLQERAARLAAEAADLLGEKQSFAPEDILVNDEYLGGGYGVLGSPEKEALRLFARTEGLLLDPVYTARAAAGLIDLLRLGFFQPGQTVLFWHTGGAPALFASQYSAEL